jgi:hypothetical protein
MQVGGRESRHHALQPERVPDAFGDFRACTVVAVERQAQILEELRAVGLHAGAQLIEDLERSAGGIGRRLQHQRRDGADQHCPGNPLSAVAADVAGDLASAGRMSDVNGILEVELGNELGQIVGVSVHVVAGPRLARAAMAAPIVGDAAVALRGEEEHLVFEGIGRQRPAMAEHDGLPSSPILIVDFCAILGGEHRHWFDTPKLHSVLTDFI